MAEMVEQTYNIPLRSEVMKAPRYKRAKKAVRAVREFLIRHSGSSDIRLGKHLNEKLWQQGIKNVPHFIKVDTIKDGKGTVTAELFGAPKEAKKEEKGKKGSEKETAAGKGVTATKEGTEKETKAVEEVKKG